MSWLELQEMPGWIVDGYWLDMRAQAEMSRRHRRAIEQEQEERAQRRPPARRGR